MASTQLVLDASPSWARLHDLRRRYQAEEAELLLDLERAHEDLDHWLRSRQQLLAEGMTAPALERLCDALGARATLLEKDLIDVRSALASLDEEISELNQPSWTWVPDVSSVRATRPVDPFGRL